MNDSARAIRLRGLCKSFGEIRALDGVDLDVQRGEFFGLLGPNGAGKSTMIRILMGLLRPGEGEVEILGRNPLDAAIEVRAQIGLLPEEPHLYERLTARESLEFTGRMYGLDEATIEGRCADLLALLELESAADRLVLDFSQGMRRKLGLALALIHNPKLLILDEPFNGVDVIASHVVRRLLQEIVGRGVTVFFSSHVLDLVERLCSRVAILHHGRIVAVGSIDEIRASLEGAEESDLETLFLRTVGEGPTSRGLSWLG